jgi:hypothetical protein
MIRFSAFVLLRLFFHSRRRELRSYYGTNARQCGVGNGRRGAEVFFLPWEKDTHSRSPFANCCFSIYQP